MNGTLLNVATVLIGGGLGTLFGSRLPAKIRETIIAGLGLFTVGLGVQMFLGTQNPLIVLGAVLVGGILGELLRIDDGLNGLGHVIERRVMGASAAGGASSRFVKGYVTASLVFCVGPMTVLGSIQDGLRGDSTLLAIKSVLDGFAALAFASSLGVGVVFAAATVLLYQGALTLAAAQAQALLTDAMVREMTAAGGVLILGIGISSLLELRPIRMGNFLPAIVLAPALQAIVPAVSTALGH
jgi:uncharacterized membrane protein YqgA involved in biofilm formation